MRQFDRPFVPRGCPQLMQWVEPFAVDPQSFATRIIRDELLDSDRDNGNTGEAVGLVGYLGSNKAHAEDQSKVILTLSMIDPESSEGRQMLALRHDRSGQTQKRLGAILCERIKSCHGVTGDGECWALGEEGVRAALVTLSENPVSPSESE